MGEARRTKASKDSWVKKADIIDFNARRASVPAELHDAFVQFTQDICDIGEDHQVPPKTIATMVSSMIGLLCLAEVEGDVRADKAIDDFLEYCARAMHMAVASERIAQGWSPPS